METPALILPRLCCSNESSTVADLELIYSLMRIPLPEFWVCVCVHEAQFRSLEDLTTNKSIAGDLERRLGGFKCCCQVRSV